VSRNLSVDELHSEFLGYTHYHFNEFRTTGGGSATPVTVTTLAALKTAVTGSTAKVVIISGTITGNDVVEIGANTSVLGKSGASKCAFGLGTAQN
jgi:pectate lyase